MTRRPLALVAALVLAGCAPGAGNAPGASGPTASSAPAPTTSSVGPVPTDAPTTAPPAPTPGQLPVDDPHAPMPAPGTCHAGQRNGQPLPDPSCTPGAVNPAVTQANIGQTICVTGWTATVRPPESKTGPMKKASAASYGISPSGTEYDHLVPLELGGAPDDPRNLWPEPGGTNNPKDRVENYLKKTVCAGRMPLATAQAGIAADWTQYLGAAGSAAATEEG